MKNRYRDELWVDLVEGEADAATATEMERTLQESPENRRTLQGFRFAKALVKKTSETDMKLGDEYFNQLHDKIMARVSAEKIQEEGALTVLVARTRRSKFAMAAAASLVAVFSMFAVMNWYKPANLNVPVAREDRAQSFERIMEASVVSPGAFTDSVINNGLGDDILMDAAETRLEGLSRTEFDSFLSSDGQE